MKTVLVIIEGASDLPQKEFEGRTPLQRARCPVARRLALEGRCGLMGAVASEQDRRPEFLLGALCGASLSDAAQLWRGPLEAEGSGLDTGAYRWACRANFVTMDDGVMRESRVQRMSMEETRLLCAAMQSDFDSKQLCVSAVAPSRAVVLLNPEGEDPVVAGNPAWLQAMDAESALPAGKKGAWVRDMLTRSAALLAGQTVNDVRIDLGENPATHMWLWGGGRITKPTSFFGGRAARGVMLTQSVMARGLAKHAGLRVIDMESPWGVEDGDPVFDEKAFRVAVDHAETLVVYVEAPLEGADFGPAVDKVRMLERLDIKLLGPLVALLEQTGPFRLLVTADNASSPRYRDFGGTAPLVLWSGALRGDGVEHFDEPSCAEGTLGIVKPEKVFELLSGE